MTILSPFRRGLELIASRVAAELKGQSLRYFFKNSAAAQKLPHIDHLYYASLAAGVEFLRYNESTDEIHLLTEDGLRVLTNRHFWMFIEVFCDKQYGVIRDFVRGDYVVFDFGANRGYSALFFAKEPTCKRVFSFEPDRAAFDMMLKNLSLNPREEIKVSASQYGLSGRSEKRHLYSHRTADWINTISETAVEKCWNEEYRRGMIVNEIEVRRASDVVTSLLGDAGTDAQKWLRVMKIDVEGAEYEVLADLQESGVLPDFTIIVGECHFGIERLKEICGDGFELVFLEKRTIPGVLGFALANRGLRCV